MRNTLLVTVDYNTVRVECVPGDKTGLPVPRSYRVNTGWYHPDIEIIVWLSPGAPLQWERANSAIMSWMQDNRFPLSALRYHRVGRSSKRDSSIDGYDQLELF